MCVAEFVRAVSAECRRVVIYDDSSQHAGHAVTRTRRVCVCVVGTAAGVASLQCELSQCFHEHSASLYVRPRCRSPRRLHITKLILGVFATRRCESPAYNACCINQTTDTWRVMLPQQPVFINASRLCNGRRDCTLSIDKDSVVSAPSQRLSDYVIIGFDCVTNRSGEHLHHHHQLLLLLLHAGTVSLHSQPFTHVHFSL